MPSIDVKILFGSSIRSWRRRLGISQEELAGRAGLHRTYVSDIERGARNVSLESVSKLAYALEVPLPALFLMDGVASDGTHVPSSAADGRLVDILFVEDREDDITLALDALNRANFSNRIQIARDGVEALDFLFCEGRHKGRLGEEGPELVLLDLGLPKVDGFEVLRRMKADPRTAAIPVVVLTVSDQLRDVAKCKRLGAAACIAKPVDFQKLSEVTPGLHLKWALLRSEAPEALDQGPGEALKRTVPQREFARVDAKRTAGPSPIQSSNGGVRAD